MVDGEKALMLNISSKKEFMGYSSRVLTPVGQKQQNQENGGSRSGSKRSPFCRTPAGKRKLVVSRKFDSLRATRNRKLEGAKAATTGGAGIFNTLGSRNTVSTNLESHSKGRGSGAASRASLAAGAALHPAAPSLSPKARLLGSKNRFRGWKGGLNEGQSYGVKMSEITPTKFKPKYSMQKIKVKGQLLKEAKDITRDQFLAFGKPINTGFKTSTAHSIATTSIPRPKSSSIRPLGFRNSLAGAQDYPHYFGKVVESQFQLHQTQFTSLHGYTSQKLTNSISTNSTKTKSAGRRSKAAAAGSVKA